MTDMTDAKDELYLVDGSGFIFRAFFALPQTLTNTKGQPVGAVLGFCNMLMKLLTDFHAPSIAVIFDAARKNFRSDIYTDYKANRSDPPDDLIPQFPLFRVAAEAFGIPAIELEGYEADDLIAAYARLARERGQKVTIVGSDKDLYQLINDDVQLWDPIKAKYIRRDEVIQKFGVPPEKVVEVQALTGDSVDNIPGVPGIGPKTAAELINEYGDLETLLSRLGEIKQNKRREVLIENADKARISKQLVKLDEYSPVPLALEDLKTRDLNMPNLVAFLQEQGFKQLISRVAAQTQSVVPAGAINYAARAAEQAQTSNNNEKPQESFSHEHYVLINDEAVLKEWIAEAYEEGMLAIDTETTAITPACADIVGISLAIRPGRAAYIPLGHAQETDLLGDSRDHIAQLPTTRVIELLRPLLEDESVLKIGHNMKYDWQILVCQGIRMHPCDDTMLISYVLDGSAFPHGMDFLSQKYLGHTPITYQSMVGKGKNQVTFDKVPPQKALHYAAEDADVTLRLHKVLKPRLAKEKMASVYENIERPLIEVIAEMEFAGIQVDAKVLNDMSTEFGRKLLQLEADIQKIAGTDFNVGSPRQVGIVLFEQMGLKGGKKTKTGDWSTTADILEKLADEGHEIVQKMLEWRQLSKLKSTYTDALQSAINPRTGRVHTSFSIAHTSTGRLASSDPNLQNIPIRTEEGRKIRQAFTAREGHVLLSADYSQVELRLIAALAGIEALKEAFRNNQDIHAITASQVFGIPLDQITPEIRRQAKAVNFGIIYGISGFGLAKQLGTSNSEAAEFIRRYLTRFRELGDYMEARKEEARQHGFIKTLYGRKCVIPGIRDKNPAFRAGAERQAINAPLQGTAADIMKLAMGRLPSALRKEGLSARMVLQVHDELVFEVPENELEATTALVRSIMEKAADVGVPLEVGTGSGKSWGAAH